MKAYWIASVNILDSEKYQKYMDVAKTVFPKYGAKFLVRTENPTVLEGKDYARHVMIEFSDMETALNCYHSADYQHAKSLRDGCSEVAVNIVPAIE